LVAPDTVQGALAVPSDRRPWKTGAASVAPDKVTLAGRAAQDFVNFIAIASEV
jgi:hypothetical protein